MNGSVSVKPVGPDGTATVAVANTTVEGATNSVFVGGSQRNMTLTVSLRDDRIGGRIDLTTRGRHTDADVAIVDTRVDGYSGANQAIQVWADDDREHLDLALDNVTVTNGSSTALEVDAHGANTTAAVSVTDSNLTSVDNHAVFLWMRGDNETLDVELRNNEVTVAVPTYRAHGVWVDGLESGSGSDGTSLELTAVNNSIEGGYVGLYAVGGRGAGDGPVDVELRDNYVNATDDGIRVQSDAVQRNVSVQVADNVVESDMTGLELSADNDGGTTTVDVRRNDVTAGTGVDLTDTGVNVSATIVVRNNTVDAAASALATELSDYDPHNTATFDVVVEDNDLTAPGRYSRGVDVGARAAETTANVTVRNNDVVAYDGVRVSTGATNQTVDAVVRNNRVNATGTGVAVSADEDGQTVTATVERNRVYGSPYTGMSLDFAGTGETVDLSVVGNRLEDARRGLVFQDVQLLDADRFDGLVRANNVSNFSSVGVEFNTVAGSGSVNGGLVVEHNDVVGDGTSVYVEKGPVAGIELNSNHLDAVGYGVRVVNATDGGAVDARYNYWGASDGPGSAGPYADPATGALADGTGSNVTGASDSATAANVLFDPYRGFEPSTLFAVATPSTNAPVNETETLTASAFVENLDAGATGPVSRTVELVVDGTVRDSVTVTLGPGESTTVSLSWATTDGDAGDYTAAVTSANDSASTSVTVESASTPTPTATPTPTPTDTPTATPTPTATATPTATSIPTSGDEETPTATATPEPTSAENPTPTPTTEPTDTQVATDTQEPTDTPTAAPTDTPTAAPTPTVEFTAPPATPTPTETGTPGFGLLVALVALAAVVLVRRAGA
jgi:PGF-CTERM protein